MMHWSGVCVLSHVRLFVIPWTLWFRACQAPLSIEFSNQEYWSGLSFPPPGDVPDSGIKPMSLSLPALAGGFFTTVPPGKPKECIQFSSVQFSRSVVSSSLWPHESQHTRPPCPSPTPGVHSDERPLSQWCHPVISSSVVPFSSCPQSLPTSESFPMSQLFAWGGQSTGASALASFLPKNTQGWSPSEWTV